MSSGRRNIGGGDRPPTTGSLGRQWEKDRLRMEFCSHNVPVKSPNPSQLNQLQYGTPVGVSSPFNRGGGRMNSRDAAPVSFVSGGHQQYGNECAVPCALLSEIQVKDECQSQSSVQNDGEGAGMETVPTVKDELTQHGEQQLQFFSLNKAAAAAVEPLNELAWVSQSDRGHLFMQMMERMGYEHGKGLGRDGQGIAEPIRPNPNPGKKALGAPEHSRARGRRHDGSGHGHRHGGGGRRNWHDDDGDDEDGGQGGSGGAARMRYQDNVQRSLVAAGFAEPVADEIWQAMGVLAKHKIMPLGMGLGLVKRMTGRRRIQQQRQEEEENCD